MSRRRAFGGVADDDAGDPGQRAKFDLDMDAAVEQLVFEADARRPVLDRADAMQVSRVMGQKTVAQRCRLEARRRRHRAGGRRGVGGTRLEGDAWRVQRFDPEVGVAVAIVVD
jgi:hypothetical protein